MSFVLATPYKCPYCAREYATHASRAAHSVRCPALKRVPNAVQSYRDMLTYLKARLAIAAKGAKPINRATAKRLVEDIESIISFKKQR